MQITKYCAIGAILFATGCAPIQHTAIIDTSIRTSGTAGVGDVVARVDKERNLQNAFGASDVFGRKTTEGSSELRYGGLDPSGGIVLIRSDVSILTNETTMSRTPISTTFVSGSANGTAVRTGNVVTGSASGTAVATTISPTSDYHAVLPAGAIRIVVPPGTTEVPFEGHILKIIGATAVGLSYEIN